MPFYVGNVISRAGECGGTGLVDTSFIDPNINGRVEAIAIQADKKILIGGRFTTVAGVTKNRIARLNYDGTLDNTFNIGANLGVSNTLRGIVVQPDQKILICGNFQIARGVFVYHAARLEPDGSLDTTFGPANTSAGCAAIGLQPDGKVVLGGDFAQIQGVTQNGIARLETDGSLDTTFNTGVNVGTSGIVRSILIQPDGKIVIGGDFDLARGVLQNGFARLNSDGSLDTSFNTGGVPGVVGPGDIFNMSLQPDGKIVLVGDFSSFRGGTLQFNSRMIARSNTDGTRDLTWPTGASVGNAVMTCEVQYDGKVFTGGLFRTMRGVDNRFFARLESNGTLDTTYNVPPPTEGVTIDRLTGFVFSSALQDDCRILIGGDFTEVRGFTRNRLCRLA